MIMTTDHYDDDALINSSDLCSKAGMDGGGVNSSLTIAE